MKTIQKLINPNLLGNREKEVLNHLDRAELIMDTDEHHVIRFYDKDGEHTFDYDSITKRIVG